MEKSTTRTLLKNKIVKILTLLLLVRLGLYIPVPGLDLDIFAQSQNLNPMFGFAKTLSQNYELLGKLEFFQNLNCPILCGVSRKSMIYKILNCTPKEALNGTTALNMMSLMNGANILRVHDVKEAIECVKLFNQI